jgi:hypothetical protein
MPWIDSLDWSALNSLRRYPIREGLSALSVDGSFSIPDTLIVDFTLCASSDVSRRFFISKIFNKLSSVIIEISAVGATEDVVVGSFEAFTATHIQDKDYYLAPTDLYVGANGKITLGSLAGLASQPSGIFSFLSAATELEPRTIIPGLQGIDRIIFTDALNGQHSLSGDVTLLSRNNLNFSYANSIVLLDVGDGLGLNKQCAITNCVQSINGVVPDPANGNISLLGINCLSIYSSAQYTLDMSDTCCTPCAGCGDLEELTVRLTSLENKFLDLKDSYNAVNSQLTTYLATINSNCACPA